MAEITHDQVNWDDFRTVADMFAKMYRVSQTETPARFQQLEDAMERLDAIRKEFKDQALVIQDLVHGIMYGDLRDSAEERFLYALGAVMGLDHDTVDQIIDNELTAMRYEREDE